MTKIGIVADSSCDLPDDVAASHGIGIVPLTIGVTGYGNVSQGVWEVLRALPVVETTPEQLEELHRPGGADRGGCGR